MFPSSFNNGNSADPINYQSPFFTDTTSKSPLDPSSFFNFPSDPLFNPSLEDLFQPVVQESTNMAESEMDKAAKQILAARKKRCKRSDRHSKIYTARGPRDRRMRLSLKVAREFFNVQDKLCFDKASKTVEWLLFQSDSAIKQLPGASNGNQSASSPSECEVISGTNEEEEDEVPPPPPATVEATPEAASETVPCGAVKKKGKKAKTALNRQDKESREKARAKAKERTREKQKLLSKKIESEEANETNQLSCWSSSDNTIEAVEETVTQSQCFNPCVGQLAEAPATYQLPAPESFSDESFGKWDTFAGLSHLYDPAGFPQQNESTADFQFCKSMWE